MIGYPLVIWVAVVLVGDSLALVLVDVLEWRWEVARGSVGVSRRSASSGYRLF